MQNLYSVYDSVTKEYSHPLTMKNDDVAKRWFHTQFLKNVDESVKGDLSILRIGAFDEETGEAVGYGHVNFYDITEAPDSDEGKEEAEF